MRVILSTLLAFTFAGCNTPVATRDDGAQAQGALDATRTHVKIGGKAMTVKEVAIWLPFQYDAAEPAYQAFIKFEGPGYQDGTDLALVISSRARGCQNDPTNGPAQQVWLRRGDPSYAQYLGADGAGCGLTVTALPNRGGHLIGTFHGDMGELNGSGATADVEIDFDIAVKPARVFIDNVEMTVTRTELWTPAQYTPDDNYFQGFISFEGPGYPAGSDLKIDAFSAGRGCSNDGSTRQDFLVRPAGENDQYWASAGADCGLLIGAVDDGRIAGNFTGDAYGLNGPGMLSNLAVIFDLTAGN